MPFSLKSFRSINKLKIIGTIPDSGPYQEYYKDLGCKLGVKAVIFEAFTSNGFSFDMISKQDKSSGFNADVGKNSTLISGVANFFGKAPAIDYPQRHLYSGTDVMSWSMDCYLPLNNTEGNISDAENTVNNQINFPIRRLIGLYLPSRSKETVGGQITEAVSGWNNSWLGDMIANVAQSGEEFIGKTYLLDVPFPYNPTEANDVKTLTFKIGGLRIEDIVVTNVKVKVPPYTYENGLPDHVDLSITFSTLRPLTTSTFGGNLFNLK